MVLGLGSAAGLDLRQTLLESAPGGRVSGSAVNLLRQKHTKPRRALCVGVCGARGRTRPQREKALDV
jgi:hypothetical protein